MTENINNQGNKRKHEVKRLQKEVVVGEIRTNLENGVFEIYQFDGSSEAWADFVKIRNSDTKEHVEFVQCIECKGLLSFKEDSGTSHLLRHRCPKIRNDSSSAIKFRSLPFDKIGPTRKSITTDIIQFCTSDMVSCEAICDSENFLNLAQSFVSLGHKNGNIHLKSVFPSSSQTNRVMSKIKTVKEQDICNAFRDSIKRQWCSATIEFQNFENSTSHITKVAVISIQHFENELNGIQKKFCFSLILNANDTQESFRAKLFKQFNHIGADKNDLLKMKIVTPNCEIFSNILALPFERNNCVVEALTKILNDSFAPTSCTGTGETDTLTNCRGIVKHINSAENYKLKLIEEDDTWKSKIPMLRSIIENSEIISKILDDEDSQLVFNKRKTDEILSFLEPFVDAIDDLKSTTYTTANKILLWHAVLTDQLTNNENSSLEMQRIRKIAKESFGLRFCLTLDNKIDCFLDPRYKALRMLDDVDRDNVIAEVRKLLEDLEVPDNCVGGDRSNYVPQTKKNRAANFEGSSGTKDKGASKKTSRFSRFESNNEEFEKMDEVAIYLKLPAMTSSDLAKEFDVMNKFWKQQKNKLPTLFWLASSRLHVPACCGNINVKPTQLKQNFKSDTLADYLFVGHNIHTGMSTLFSI